MSIKAAIIEKNEGEEVEKSEYTNLIMDDMEIKQISEEDRVFLEGFVECQFLSLNSTKLESLDNMPKLERLERLELCENTLGGAELGATIARLYPNLVTIKLASNKIEDVGHISGLKSLTKLESLDLSDNPICGALGSDYQKKVRDVLSEKLEILDCLNKAGEEVVSDEDESDLDGDDEQSEEDDEEEGEDEMESGDEDPEEAKQEDKPAKDAAAEAGADKGAAPEEEATEETTTDQAAAAKKAKTDADAPDLPATTTAAVAE